MGALSRYHCGGFSPFKAPPRKESRWKKGLLPASVGTLRNRQRRVKIPNWAKIQTIDTNSCRKSRLVVLSRARESSCRAKEAKLAMSSARRRRVESGDVSEPRQGYFTINIQVGKG